MPIYRYRALLNLTQIQVRVPGTITLGPSAPATFADIGAPAGSKEDLDAYMEDLGFTFESTDPDVTPTEETASEGLSENMLIFRPGVASDPKHVETWAEVEIAIALFSGVLNIVIDDRVAPAIVPATADTECFGSLVLSSLNPIQGAVLTIADGGRLRNLGVLGETVILLAAPTVRSPLYFGGLGLGFQGFLISGGVIGNATSATKAMIEVDTPMLALVSELISALDNMAEPTIPLVHINPGNSFGWNVQQYVDQVMSPNTVEGDATTTLNIDNDASVVGVTQALFLGSFLNNRLSKAEALQPSAGNTRPANPFTGQEHFDTSLTPAKPIWWSGSGWVDASGIAA